jgi:hypothetical protein
MEPCPSSMIEHDLEIWKARLNHDISNSNTPQSYIRQAQDKIKELEYQLKMSKDYESNLLTKEPPFEEPKQYDIGFIPTVEQLILAFQQMPSSWPGETYTHELKTSHYGFPYPIENSLGKLTFNKIDGQWVYFGPTKYK